ncbi:MAG: hypothetical protein ACE5D3_07350, partial [Candidatus Binatia bacterium]
KSPTDPLEGTVSQRQLHEASETFGAEPARACGMEARDVPQHRTKVKPRKAGLIWVSVPPIATPDIQSRQDGSEDGGGGKLLVLTRGGLHGSARCGRRLGDGLSMFVEKSDHFIRALKPGNAGGAKGVMD